MPKKILDKLNATMVVSTESVEVMEKYIAREYPDLSRDESQKVLIQYIHQQLEENLKQFDEKYLPYIKFRLMRIALSQKPYQIGAGDVLKACVQLNFGIDGFYQELTQWILDYVGSEASEAEVRSFVLKLRQWARWNADKPLEDMFREENLSQTAVSQLTPQQNENSLWRESNTGRLVPVDSNNYFHENEWKPKEKNVSRQLKGTAVFRNIAIASVSLLLLAGGSIWMASSYTYEKNKPLKAALPVMQSQEESAKSGTKLPETGAKSVKTQPVVIAANDYTTEARAGRNEIVNRSRTVNKAVIEARTKEKLLPSIAKAVTEPVAQADKMVIVGYEEGTKNPIVRDYGTKLTMSAKGYLKTKNDNSPISESLNTYGNGPVTKSRIVAANPRVIPPGSRVYLNFPSEYQDMDGVYTVEANNGVQSHQIDVFFGEEAEGDDNVSKRIEDFGSNGVDVYILK